MYFKYTLEKYKSNRTCVCGLGQVCVDIQDEFRALNDLRGQVQTIPNPTSSTKSSSQSPVAANKHHYVKRVQAHCIQAKDQLKLQSNLNPVRLTRASKSERTEAYVALWHFDRKILERIDIKTQVVPFFLPVELAIECQIYHPSGGCLYTSADVCPNIVRRNRVKGEKELAIVPTFFNPLDAKIHIEKAKADKEVLDERELASQRVSQRLSRSTGNVSTSNKRRKSNPVPSILKNDEFMKLSKKEKQAELDRIRKDIHAYVEAKEAEIHSYESEERDLLRKIDILQDTIREGERISNNPKLSFTAIQKQHVDNQISMVQQLKLLSADGGGLNRISMTTRKVFEKNPNLCKSLFGFSDFDFCIDFIESAFAIKFIEPRTVGVTGGGKYGGLNEVEQVLLTLLWTNTFWNRAIVGFLFGIKSKDTVSKYVNRWMPLLGECGDMMSSFLPYLDEAALDALEPQSYIDMDLRKIGLIVDGKDFLTETVRSDRVLNCALASNKMHHSCFRVLTWSLPCGAVVERTPAFFARASEKALMNTWGNLGQLKLPAGYLILGDKGFDNTASCYENYNTTLHPAFLTNDQFNKDQINHNLTICQKRYSCETVYSRVIGTMKLTGIYKREHFHHFEALAGWAHGRANLCYGYLQKIHS